MNTLVRARLSETHGPGCKQQLPLINTQQVPGVMPCACDASPDSVLTTTLEVSQIVPTDEGAKVPWPASGKTRVCPFDSRALCLDCSATEREALPRRHQVFPPAQGPVVPGQHPASSEVGLL